MIKRAVQDKTTGAASDRYMVEAEVEDQGYTTVGLPGLLGLTGKITFSDKSKAAQNFQVGEAFKLSSCVPECFGYAFVRHVEIEFEEDGDGKIVVEFESLGQFWIRDPVSGVEYGNPPETLLDELQKLKEEQKSRKAQRMLYSQCAELARQAEQWCMSNGVSPLIPVNIVTAIDALKVVEIIKQKTAKKP